MDIDRDLWNFLKDFLLEFLRDPEIPMLPFLEMTGIGRILIIPSLDCLGFLIIPMIPF